MAFRNKHGLDRNIPAGIKREVRQRCGFGCVICGSALYEYEHFNPTFAEAKEHSAEGIVLLCRNHHGGKGTLTAPSLIESARKDPFALRLGHTTGEMEHGSSQPALRIGSNIGRDVDVMLHVLGDDVLSLLPPEQEGAPYRVTARFKDRSGETILEIVENEIRASTGNWDIEFVGQHLIIRDSGGVSLRATIQAGVEVGFDEFLISHSGVEVWAEPDGRIWAALPDGAMTYSSGWTIEHAAYFMLIEQNGLVMGRPRPGGFVNGHQGETVFVSAEALKDHKTP